MSTNTTPVDRHDVVQAHLEQAIELSYPLFTYKELKKLVGSVYHGFVMKLRGDKTWDQVTQLTGMTRAGLNKLGDIIPPKPASSPTRQLLMALHRAGDEGMSAGALASAFYGTGIDLGSGPTFEQALHALKEVGLVTQRDRRYIAVDRKEAHLSWTDIAGRPQLDKLTESILQTTRIIARRSVEDNETHKMHRLTFDVPADPESLQIIHKRLKLAAIRIAQEAEEEAKATPHTTTMTVVLAGGTNVA